MYMYTLPEPVTSAASSPFATYIQVHVFLGWGYAGFNSPCFLALTEMRGVISNHLNTTATTNITITVTAGG